MGSLNLLEFFLVLYSVYSPSLGSPCINKGPIKLHHLLEENGHLCIIDGERKSNNNGSIIFLFRSFLSLGLGPLILISSKWLGCGFSFRKLLMYEEENWNEDVSKEQWRTTF